MGSRVRGAALLLASVVGVVGLAGCADDDPPEPDPSDSAGATDSPSPSGSPSESATTDAAAAGPVVDTDVLTYRLPEGRWDTDLGGMTAIWEGDSRSWLIASTVEPGYADLTMAEVAQVTLELNADHDPPLARAGSREVGGVRGYVIEGRGPGGFYYEWGTVLEGHYVQLQFEFPEDSARAQEWVESVLASVAWK